MAKDLIRLSGLEPDVDIKIEFIGLRPGEKLHEELRTEVEDLMPTDHEKIMVMKGVECDLDSLHADIGELLLLAKLQDGNRIMRKLQEIVHGYRPNGISIVSEPSPMELEKRRVGVR
jgi:FlaA1/EpsC-like NDP-sugar epimerase